MGKTSSQRIFRRVSTLIFLVILFLILLFGDFLYRTGRIERVGGKSDAIVVLTGGRGRVEEGFRLFRDGEGGTLLLLGVSPRVTVEDLFGGRIRGIDPSRIVLEKGSRTTIENALFGRKILQDRNIRSIRLITSRYHMLRSLLLFQRILPPDVRIVPHPVESRVMNGWSAIEWSGVRLLWSEMYKYWMYRLFFLIVPENDVTG
ncbi:MAG: YdcF family protein [Desulfuromonadia bacterium]